MYVAADLSVITVLLDTCQCLHVGERHCVMEFQVKNIWEAELFQRQKSLRYLSLR